MSIPYMSGFRGVITQTPHVMDRLQAAIPVIEKLKAVGGTAGVSIGVSLPGEQPFTLNLGYRDFEEKLPTESSSIFTIGSLTKAFTSAICARLVADGLASWDSPIDQLLPGLQVEPRDPRLGSLTLADILSHRTGLAREDALWLGADNEVLLKKNQVVDAVRGLKAVYPLRSQILYNNFMYGIAGEIIEHISGKSYDDLLEEFIAGPLKMEKTTTKLNKVDNSSLAKPYMVLNNYSLQKVHIPAMNSGEAMVSAGGVRSSIADMLKWTSVLLQAIKQAEVPGEAESSSNPISLARDLFSGHTILKASPRHDELYALGWAKVTLPSRFGKLGFNPGLLKDMPILGVKSPAQTVFYHNGAMAGYNHCLMLVPDRNISIIVFTNSISRGDTADWIAEALLTAVLDLEPATDFVELATEASNSWSLRYTKMEEALQDERTPNTVESPAEDFVGTYKHTSGTMEVVVSVKGDGNLRFVINNSPSQTHDLVHYNWDTYSFLHAGTKPLERGVITYAKSAWLLHFERNKDGAVDRIKWVLDAMVKDGDFLMKQ